jgi:flagellar hook-associated protein 1
MGTFSGLSTALSSLYAQRRALDITSQNVANVNTEGYSKQRAELAEISGSPVPARYSSGVAGPNGVKVTGITRLHDEFLENRSRAERGLNAHLAGQRDVYARIEAVINEPSDTGVQSQMAELWAAWSDVANRPDDLTARNVVLERSRTIADSLADAHTSLSSLWGSSREQLDERVLEINTTARSVGDYNHRILVNKVSGVPATELEDQRDLLVQHLSEMTGATGTTRTDGRVDVYISGSPLVFGDDARTIEAVGPPDMAGVIDPADPTGQTRVPVLVRWTDMLGSAGITSGSIASSLETLNTTIPDAADHYDDLANRLGTAINTKQMAGYDLKGVIGVNPLFTGVASPVVGGPLFTATTLKVAITDPSELAASDQAPTTDINGNLVPNLGGANADAIAAIARDPTGPDSVYRGFVTQTGVLAQTVNRRADIQDTITTNVTGERDAATGVSLDEEMINMIQFQRAYEAAAKVINTIDATLDTLINTVKR